MNNPPTQPKSINWLVKTKMANRAYVLISMLAPDSTTKIEWRLHPQDIKIPICQLNTRDVWKPLMSRLYFSQPSYSLFIAHNTIA